MLAQWLSPIPEKEYIRVVYCGKLRCVSKDGRKNVNLTLEDMVAEIWRGASEFNRRNFISGHLACTKNLYVVQLLEGKEQVVLSLMERIRKDPRVVIHNEFVKRQVSMHLGWAMMMCYSFEINPSQMEIIQDHELTLEDIFEMMKDTYEVQQEGKDLQNFYHEMVETILLKFIAITDGKEKVM